MRCLFLLAAASFLVTAPALRADAFDRYVNPILVKAPSADGVKEINELTPDMIADNDRVLPGDTSALVIVKTNEARFSKLLVVAAGQKKNGKVFPIMLIGRYVTYKEGQERAVQATGHDLHLYEGLQLNLDLGQVVPPSVGGDLQLIVEKKGATEHSYLKPVAKAKMYLVTKALPGTEPRPTDKLVIGETFEPRYFNGTYKLYDDGRRSGTLVLRVDKDGDVTGDYFSDKDGSKYEVNGKIGTPRHSIQFTIKFPRTEQMYQGWLFTGDGKALTGSSRLQERETGFYAVRVEKE